MTKQELLRLLEPFDDDLEVYAVVPGGNRLPIFHGAYWINDGEGMVDLFVDGAVVGKGESR